MNKIEVSNDQNKTTSDQPSDQIVTTWDIVTEAEQAAREKRRAQYEAEEREIFAYFTKLAEDDDCAPPRLPGPSSTR